MLIKPSKANVSSFLKKIRAVIKGNKAMDQLTLIRMLNPMIKGWAAYHQHIVAKVAFNKVDNEIWLALWRWAVRRHPNKGKKWINKVPETGLSPWLPENSLPTVSLSMQI